MTIEQNKQIMRRMIEEIWNQGNLALIPEIYTTDCVVTTSSSPQPFVGHEGIKQWVESNRAMMPDLVMAFPEVVAVPGKTVTVWTLTATQTGPMVTPGGTMPSTGKKISVSGMSIDYLKDGKCVKEVVVNNALDMMMQMGFTLNPPRAAE